MKIRKTTRNIILSGLFIAIGIVLPIVFHAIPDAGKVFLPMFIPIIIAGVLLPWKYSAAVGVITPLLSSLLTGMPPMVPIPMAVMMCAEFVVLTFILWLLVQRANKKVKLPRLVASILLGILLGQITSGIVLWGAIQFFSVKGPGLVTYVTGAVVAGLPGIAIQVVLIPILYYALYPVLKNNAA